MLHPIFLYDISNYEIRRYQYENRIKPTGKVLTMCETFEIVAVGLEEELMEVAGG